MSRLDRFIVSKGLIEDWLLVDQRVGCRDISDHAPVSLTTGSIDWGP